MKIDILEEGGLLNQGNLLEQEQAPQDLGKEVESTYANLD